MGNDFFEVAQEVYFEGGIGNTLVRQFYKDRINGGSESQFAKLAVYLELEHGITCTKKIETKHIYEFLMMLKNYDFAESTLKNYVSAFRNLYRWNEHLFSESFENPSNTGFANWIENNR